MTPLRVSLWQHVVFFSVLALVLAPLFFLVLGSFSTARLPGDFSFDKLGWVNYVKVYTDPGTYELFTNTVIYVGGSSLLSITLAVTLAWLVERTNLPAKVRLRLLAPGLVAVMIYQAMTALEVFEIPGILRLAGGIYVFSTKIYAIVRSATFLPVYGQANALAMVYLVIAVVTTFFYARMISRVEKYTIITGKGYRPRQLDLGRWKYPAFALVVLYLFLAIVLPFFVFVYVSFLPFLQTPSLAALQNLTLKNYRLLAQYGEV